MPRDLAQAWEPLFYHDRVVGAVLRTRQGVKPLFVSSGHGLSLPSAIVLTLACCGRLPPAPTPACGA